MHRRLALPVTTLAALVSLAIGLLSTPATAHAKTPHTPSENTSPTGKASAASPAQRTRKSSNKRSSQVIGSSYAHHPVAQAWVDDAATRLSLPAAWIRQQIGQAHRLPQVEKLVLPAPGPSAKNWAAYRERFVEGRRIEAGMAFWRRHQDTLQRAEQTYGVPAQIIVGVIGVETLYGQHTGHFRILDALATLAFNFPSAHPRASERQAFFRSELEQFLLLTQKNNADPLSLRGSYAGAMGLPQFMPSSWARFAVDFDGDDRVDLFNSPADAIGSVAHYFQAFQWKPGLPTHYPVTLTPGHSDMDTLLAPDILPTFSVERFIALGAQLDGPALQHPGPLALIELRNGEQAPSHVAGTENFYAITRYNWSSYYAMAVIELGQAVAQRMAR
ncbi:MAG: lytic murein transglycosylase B [Betaproteobacteria bacterium]|nr:lytic murein transglycosylase B [Betaproteobacteria bacterium]